MAVELPPRLARMSRVPMRLLRWGIPMGPLVLLRTVGRRSGLPRTAPVALVVRDDQTWLVSPFGDTQWVRNVRAHAVAELGRGRRLRTVHLIEVDGAVKVEVLRAYRRKYKIVPFVRTAFRAGPDDDVTAFAAEAGDHPAFRVER